MTDAIWRSTLVLNEAASGLGWSLTTRLQAADPDTALAAADAFMDKYMACCPDSVSLTGFRVSNPEFPGQYEDYAPTSFIHSQGAVAGGAILPLAEALLAKGDDSGNFSIGHAHWYLHGIVRGIISNDGTLNQADADVVALTTAAKAYFLNYREEETPKEHWPVVSPPQVFDQFALKGPYVRRLGQGFFRAGQHRRYKT